MDPRQILEAWSVPEPWTLRPAGAGTNNRSHVVETSGGDYVLRVYQNTRDPGRIRYEHALLTHLQAAGLSFAIPLPLATDAGKTFVSLGRNDNGVVAALFPIVQGQHPERGNCVHAVVCGEALAELDGALSRTSLDPSLPASTTYGVLDLIHPLVPDPLAEVERVAVDEVQRRRLRILFAELLARIPDLYTRLPRQIIHADPGLTNMLTVSDRVTGILDFEVASPDLRAMDFAVGVWSFGLSARATSDPWPVVTAFAEGYRRRLALSGDEIAALPTLIRLREAASLVHRVGRLQQGLEMEGDIKRRSEEMVRLDDWLRAHGEELVGRVGRAMR